MQLHNLFKPIEEMSDDDIRARIQEIRHNRTVIRPAAKSRAKRAESKGRVSKINKAQGLLAGLSPEQIKQLILDLGTE